MALTTSAKVKAWANPDLDSTRDTELDLAITRGDAWIKRVSGQILEQDTFTEYVDGIGQRVIPLHPGRRPVIHTGGTLITMTEAGSSLTLAIGYSATADVLIDGANEDRQCFLISNGSRFASGQMFYQIDYTAGPATVDADVEQLANEVAWLFFKSPDWIAKAAVSGSRGTVTFSKDLTPLAMATLKRLKVKH